MPCLPRYKIFVPGNHDLTLDPTYYDESSRGRGGWSRLWHPDRKFPDLATADATLTKVHMLRDTGATVHGLRMYGFPHLPTPHYPQMGFSHDLKE